MPFFPSLRFLDIDTGESACHHDLMSRPPASRPKLVESDEIAIRHGAATFRVRVARRASARRFSLRVSPATREVVVTLPPRGSIDRARAFVESHGGWIATRLEKLPDRVPFEPGESIPLRGVPHRLVHRQAARGVVTPGEDARGQPILAIYGDPRHTARRLRDWLVAEARRDLEAAVRRHARRLGREASRLSIKDTVSRWGSCSANGWLSFSWRLVLAPPMVLDYLAAHEVAHLKEMNHSRRYWRIVEEMFPRWREAEAWLKRNGTGLHRYG